MKVWGEWRVHHVAFLCFLLGMIACAGLFFMTGAAEAAPAKKDNPLYLTHSGIEVRVWIDPEKGCQYLVSSERVYGGAAGGITPRMHRAPLTNIYTQVGCINEQ